MTHPNEPEHRDRDDLPPGEHKTGVTEGWQSGVGSTFPDPHESQRSPKLRHPDPDHPEDEPPLGKG